jgi:hypothetical protein
MHRARTVGRPSLRTRPPGLGMATRLPGRGEYVPARRDVRMAGQWCWREPGRSSPLIPSPPGLPPCGLTRATAARRGGLSTTRSLRPSSSPGGLPPDAPPGAAPLCRAQGSARGWSGALRRANLRCPACPPVRPSARAACRLCRLRTPPLGAGRLTQPSANCRGPPHPEAPGRSPGVSGHPVGAEAPAL